MSKAKIQVAFGETPATSSKINTLVDDYLRRGQLIHSSSGAVIQTLTGINDTGPLVTVRNPFYLGWYPYNPAKQIFDRLYILAAHAATDIGGATRALDMHLQYSVNSGTGWTNVPNDFSGPVLMNPPQSGTGMGPTGAGVTVDISSIASFQWIGFRYSFDVTVTAASWSMFAFLYLSTDTPF